MNKTVHQAGKPWSPAEDIPGRGVNSIENGGRLLTSFIEAGRPLMLKELVKASELPAGQAHAYLLSFRRLGLVEHDPGVPGRYRLGPLALHLGLAKLRGLDSLQLVEEAVPEFSQCIGLMVAVTIWGTHGPTIVRVQEASHQIHANVRAGVVFSLTGTATGRLFAAFMPSKLIDSLVKAELRDATRQHIGTPGLSLKSIRKDMLEIRRLGYSVTEGKPVPGINAISAPVFDQTGHIQLAITAIGPSSVVDCSVDSPLVEKVCSFAERISAQLGYVPT